VAVRGLRASRRIWEPRGQVWKDPIDMTIEEMEAELEETNEAIRKRRRGTLGLMLKHLDTDDRRMPSRGSSDHLHHL
jgi:hypothetical protein